MSRKSLGRGLDSLFSENPEIEEARGVSTLDVNSVIPDEDQNRSVFNEEALKELSESIKTHGIIQPLVVRENGDGTYRLIAGERRYRAAKLAGLTQIPAIVKNVTDREAAEMALIENLQREDLDPIDEAMGFEKLIKKYGATQEEAADKVGRSRPAVANSLRLLGLPDSAKTLIRRGVISSGHGRALLSLKDEALINEALKIIVDRDLSVRETEALVKQGLPKKKAPKPKPDEVLKAHMAEIAEKAGAALGRKFAIDPASDGSGRITLEYFDNDDLEELLETLCGKDFLV